jgi:septal ring factor EnvC (AmiA/AmiB activator)
MLPCDPRIKSSVEEVSKASEARLEALMVYIGSTVSAARGETDNLRRMLSELQNQSADLNSERVQTNLELAAIEKQLADLDISARQRPSLAEPRKLLEDLRAAGQQRASGAPERNQRINSLIATLVLAIPEFTARQAALLDVQARAQSESALWRAYYVARIARADTECSVTGISGGAPQGKKK